MLSIASRSYFSLPLLRGAAQFARQSRQYELAHSGSFEPDKVFEHRACVLGAVFLSTAALEATANELFSDAAETAGSRVAHLTPETRELMSRLWEKGIPRTARYKILEKYDIALTLMRKDPLDVSKYPYQDAKALVTLRNALIHFEPSWQLHDTGQGIPAEKTSSFEKALKGKFAVNPLAGAGNPYYPDKLLGHGCAAWAVGCTISFINNFVLRTGAVAPYDGNAPEYATS